MKNDNIKKINGLGKAMRIILNIAKALMIVVSVCVLIAGIAIVGFLPSDVIKSKGSFVWQAVEDDTNLPSIFGGSVIEMEEGSGSIDILGFTAEYENEKTSTDDGDVTIYDTTGSFTLSDARVLKILLAVLFGAIELICITFIIALFFGARLAKALEKCESPFEDNVLRAMKAFGFSLIPWAFFNFSSGNASGLAVVIIVLVVMLFAYIFNYGAQLQKESDETL